MILECINLSKSFGKLKAVDDLSFDVSKGEIFGIAGPNGAGKTTLYNLITGIYQGTGKILFEGEDLNGMRSHRICHKGVARTFQIPQLFLTLSVYDNVRAGAHFGSQGKANEAENIQSILEFTGLIEYRDTIAANLNLWNKKMTMIAAALSTHPQLLLLDEPIAGLNPSEIRMMVDNIKRINTELGLTVIIIEHFMKVLTELSQRLMIIENGALVCIGEPAAVIQDKNVIDCYLGGSNA
jgi:branched-chain amino acid transport system ATP-binding protein